MAALDVTDSINLIEKSLKSFFSLEGKTALCTGASRGIGKAMALALAEAGADIFLIQRDPESDAGVQKDIQHLGRKCSVFYCDLSVSSSVEGLIETIERDLQEVRIDILLNNAGIQKRHPCDEFPLVDWTAVMQVNLHAVFTLCRDVGKHMLERNESGQGGRIINLASLLTFQGGLNIPAYAASKGAIGQLTKALSNEWASRGITVNAIAPGYISTDMNTALINDPVRSKQILERIPVGRWGNPDDFKGAIIYLASSASAYVSGSILTIDGGWMAR